MTAKQLDEKIRAIAPKWLFDEIDNLIEIAKVEEWEDPPIDCVECLNMFDGQDWADTTKFRNAVKKIDKALGLLVQVKEGEEVLTMNGLMRVGQWRYVGGYNDLLNGAEE